MINLNCMITPLVTYEVTIFPWTLESCFLIPLGKNFKYTNQFNAQSMGINRKLG